MTAMKSAALVALALFLAAAPIWADASKIPGTIRKPPRTGPFPRLGRSPASAGTRWAGEPISLDIKDADLRDVIHTFAELTGLNIVVDPEVRGSVTVRLHDVPWDQALDLIVRSNGLGYVIEGNVLRVGTISKLADR
jgi:type II secretory pathway component GspD/PulD (secretin)